MERVHYIGDPDPLGAPFGLTECRQATRYLSCATNAALVTCPACLMAFAGRLLTRAASEMTAQEKEQAADEFRAVDAGSDAVDVYRCDACPEDEAEASQRGVDLLDAARKYYRDFSAVEKGRLAANLMNAAEKYGMAFCETHGPGKEA